MPNEIVPRFEELPENCSAYVDAPRSDQTVYDECISVSGWIFFATRDPSVCRVRAWLDGTVIGETRVLFPRRDVSEFLSLPHDVPTGFRFLARLTQPIEAPSDATIQLSASWNGDATEYQLGKVALHLVPASLQNRPYGEVVFPAQTTLLRRNNIYGSGPPMLEPGIEMLNLILNYLPLGSSVVDIGCGAGAYGPGLIAAGHHWTGLEVNAHCLELLEQRGLSFRKTMEGTPLLPCADLEFDAAICIEVLEHIEEPAAFLKEISRIVGKRAVFSVPNLEVLPYFKDWEAVPWHMLEGDHKNFFTRSSLRELLAPHFSRVEVFSAIEHPLRTRDGIPLHAHLLAVADR